MRVNEGLRSENWNSCDCVPKKKAARVSPPLPLLPTDPSFGITQERNNGAGSPENY